MGEAIILKQVAAAGPSFTVGVPEVLALKEAGASDELIDGLMDLAGILPGQADEPVTDALPVEPSAGEGASEQFRIYREKDGEGREVVHITNLDAAGQRLGGPPPDDGVPAPHNTYVSRSDDHEMGRYLEPDVEPPPTSRGGAVPPVVVNVFQPDAEPVAVYEEEGWSREPLGRRYVAGYLPGFYGSHGQCRHGYIFGVPSPPGSYSHFKRFHTGGSVGHTGLYHGGLAYHRARQYGFVRPLSGYTLPVPFHTAGADLLNRMRANVKLGH